MKKETNPFRLKSWMPHYAAMTPALCAEVLEEALPQAERAFKMVEKQADISWRGLMIASSQAVQVPFETWGSLCHLNSVISNDEWRKVEEKYQPAIIALSQLVAQSKVMYEGMLSLLETDKKLKPWQRHVLESSIRGMRLSGVGLSGADRKRFNKLQADLAKLTMKFANNVLDSEREAKIVIEAGEEAGIPKDLLKGDAPWTLGVDFATFDPVMRYAESSEVRERFWRVRSTRASSGKMNNAPLIEKILKLRQQVADLLGFQDYAHLSTASKMAGTPDKVLELLDPMVAVGKPVAKEEERELARFAKQNGFKGKLQPWDKAYWIERLSQSLFGFDEEALREYFPMERVLEGLFALCNELFSVTFERAKGNIHAWHKDVRFYRVKNAKDEVIAGFYFDPYARPGVKRGGAWMNNLRSRDFEINNHLPISVIVCNQKPPQGKKPATMSFYEVVTLFHEMGHALQEMLTTIDSPSCSGINNVEWDAVEIASQFLEQFPYEPKILKSLSAHVKTGEPITDELAQAIVQKRTFRAGNALVRQIHFAETDLFLHSKAYPRKYKNANACKEAFAKKLLPAPFHPDDRFLNAFTHIFAGGYSAGYYSYKWSETLSADIYGAFVGEKPATRRRLGKKYRDTILALGGSKPAAEVFRQLMGRDPDADAILRLTGLKKD